MSRRIRAIPNMTPQGVADSLQKHQGLVRRSGLIFREIASSGKALLAKSSLFEIAGRIRRAVCSSGKAINDDAFASGACEATHAPHCVLCSAGEQSRCLNGEIASSGKAILAKSSVYELAGRIRAL